MAIFDPLPAGANSARVFKNEHIVMTLIDSCCSLSIKSRIGWNPHPIFNCPSSTGELQIVFEYPPDTEWGEHEYACLKDKLLDYLPKLIDHLKAYPTMLLSPQITNWH